MDITRWPSAFAAGRGRDPHVGNPSFDSPYWPIDPTPVPLATPESARICVLIVDDHTLVREGLRMFLSLDPQIEVVGEASDGETGVMFARKLRPHVVLMDLRMGKLDGVAATAIICQELPGTEVIILSAMMDAASIVAAVRAGAIGYLGKDTHPDELIQAIRAAREGRVHLAPGAAQRLMREMQALESPTRLTPRERDVLRLLAQGLTNKEIAAALSLSEKSIKAQVSHLMAKLGVRSRTEAALRAVRLGLVSPESAGRAC